MHGFLHILNLSCGIRGLTNNVLTLEVDEDNGTGGLNAACVLNYKCR